MQIEAPRDGSPVLCGQWTGRKWEGGWRRKVNEIKKEEVKERKIADESKCGPVCRAKM